MIRTLRDYQVACGNAIDDKLSAHRSTLAVMATGLGKTIIMSAAAKRWSQRGHVLCLAHRVELLDQAAARFAPDLGYVPDIIQATRDMDTGSLHDENRRVVVASVQTLAKEKRLGRIKHLPFSLIMIDEAHHATARSYRLIVDYLCDLWPQCKVLGVTATPRRSDKKALGIVFESEAYKMESGPAIEGGWLVEPIEERVTIDGIDFEKIKLGTNEEGETDFDQATLEALMLEERPLQAVAVPLLEKSREGRKSLVFTSGVQHAHILAGILNRERQGSAIAIDGTSTPPGHPRREQAIRDFSNGSLQYLCNFGVFCLDLETEILTSDGWTGIDEMTYAHKVANWDNGAIFFDEPKFIIRRDRLPGEEMYSVEGRRHSIRVTGDHRMLARKDPKKLFEIIHAKDLAGVKCQVPVSGVAEPFDVQPMQPGPITERDRQKAVRVNSYALRKAGWPAEDSKLEAVRRLDERDLMRRKNPVELTRRECSFIGFFLAEGSRSEPSSGGVEYVISQSMSYPNIIAWFDELLSKMKVDVCRREYPDRPCHGVVTWSFSRGTGFGPQKRNGLFSIEPYLDKKGSPLLWGLAKWQFDAFIIGLWMGDGDHGKANSIASTFRVTIAEKGFCDLIQAIAACRGYRTSLRRGRDPVKEHHKQTWRITLSEKAAQGLANETLQCEKSWFCEQVWCVTSTTGNIVTRRHGIVTVTGNTEGFDSPACSMVTIARPTKSLTVLIQMIGRGLRPLPGVVDGHQLPAVRRAAIAESGKPSALVLYFIPKAANIKTVTTYDALAGNFDDDDEREKVVALAKEMSQEKPNAKALETLKQAAALYRLLAEDEARKKIKAKVEYRTERIGEYAPDAMGENVSDTRRGGASDKQIQMLLDLGVSYATAAAYQPRQASAVIDSLRRERCTAKQRRILEKYGESHDVNFHEARKIIDEIVANGWQPRKVTA